jgi:hypothetical protein
MFQAVSGSACRGLRLARPFYPSYATGRFAAWPLKRVAWIIRYDTPKQVQYKPIFKEGIFSNCRLTLHRRKKMHKSFLRILLCLTTVILLVPQNLPAETGPDPDPYETYTFEREIRLAPGEFYAVIYNNDRKEFTETEPDRGYEGLPDSALRQVLRSPLWLREKFIDRLVDLYYNDIDVGDDAVPVFRDVNDDELRDLLVGNADGEIKCFLAPYFRENQDFETGDIGTPAVAEGQGFSLTGAEDGSITVITDGGIDTARPFNRLIRWHHQRL